MFLDNNKDRRPIFKKTDSPYDGQLFTLSEYFEFHGQQDCVKLVTDENTCHRHR